jgi:Carboxypeptidase regulatory-like domain
MKLSLLLAVFCSVLWSQVSSGTFFGQAQDQSGASVSGVHVTVREEKTNFLRETMTDETGSYHVPDLDPGIYSITAERKGFREFIAKHVVLEINQSARVNLALELGVGHEAVVVTTPASPLQTADSSEGYHFGSALFTELPIDGRNILSLITVGPGVIFC